MLTRGSRMPVRCGFATNQVSCAHTQPCSDVPQVVQAWIKERCKARVPYPPNNQVRAGMVRTAGTPTAGHLRGHWGEIRAETENLQNSRTTLELRLRTETSLKLEM